MKNSKIEETRGGANRRYAFNEIPLHVSEGKENYITIPCTTVQEGNNIRSAASVYARTHNVKFICRTQRDDKKQITGVKVYRVK